MVNEQRASFVHVAEALAWARLFVGQELLAAKGLRWWRSAAGTAPRSGSPRFRRRKRGPVRPVFLLGLIQLIAKWRVIFGAVLGRCAQGPSCEGAARSRWSRDRLLSRCRRRVTCEMELEQWYECIGKYERTYSSEAVDCDAYTRSSARVANRSPTSLIALLAASPHRACPQGFGPVLADRRRQDPREFCCCDFPIRPDGCDAR